MKSNDKIRLQQLALFLLFVLCGGTLLAEISRRNNKVCGEFANSEIDHGSVKRVLLRANGASKSPTLPPSIAKPTKANILIIAIDDCSDMAIPRALSSEYSQFLNTATAFVGISPIPICLPSRVSFLYGRVPDRTDIVTFERYPQQAAPNISSVFEYFKNKNYTSWVVGKVFHILPADIHSDVEYYTGQVSLPMANTQQAETECVDKAYCTTKIQNIADLKSVEIFDKFLHTMAAQPEKNFIAGVGLHRPHLQDAVPASFANSVPGDLPEYIMPTIPGVENFYQSLSYLEDITDANRHFQIEFPDGSWKSILANGRNNVWDLFQPQYNATVQAYRAAYYAAIRFSLDNLGKVLALLNKYGYTNNTHVVFVGDHGFKHGEFFGLGKETLREPDIRVPFVIHRAGQTQGFFNPNPVSTRSLYATLIELIDGPQAVQDFDDGSGLPLDSVSLVPALNDPTYQVPELVFSQYPRCQSLGSIQNNACAASVTANACDRAPILFMGYVVVNTTYRYTEWREYHEKQTTCGWPTWPDMPPKLYHIGYPWMGIDAEETRTNWDVAPIQQELYEVVNGVVSTNNLAVNPSKPAQAIMNQFSNQLKLRLQSV